MKYYDFILILNKYCGHQWKVKYVSVCSQNKPLHSFYFAQEKGASTKSSLVSWSNLIAS